jgi:hypothetical protein
MPETRGLLAAYPIKRVEDVTVIVAFVAVIVAGVAAPFFAYAWAMQHRRCPDCGASVSPDPDMVHAFTGR